MVEMDVKHSDRQRITTPVGLLLTLPNCCFATHCYNASEELEDVWHQVLDRCQTNVLLSKADWKFEIKRPFYLQNKKELWALVICNDLNAWNWHLHAEMYEIYAEIH